MAGIDGERGGVGGVEAFDEFFGSQKASAAGACLDSSGFVDLISERGDLGSPCRDDAADVLGRTPVETGAIRDFFGAKLLVFGVGPSGLLKGSGHSDACPCRRGL